MTFFFVASRGLTATKWFCHALSLHPLTFCSHGRDRPSRGLNITELLKSKDYRDDRLRYEKWQRSAKLNQYMEELKKASGGKKILGNIHGYILPELIDKLREVKLKKEMPIANMTRDPIKFVESYNCLVKQNKYEYPEKYYKEHLPRAKANAHLLEAYSKSSETDYEMQGFIEGCQMLIKMIADLKYDHVPVIIMEKLTSDKEYFKNFVAFLSNNVVNFSQREIDQIFNTGKMNSHREKIIESDIKSSSEEIWADWSATKRQAFHEIIGRKSLKKHELLGYDFSYLAPE